MPGSILSSAPTLAQRLDSLQILAAMPLYRLRARRSCSLCGQRLAAHEWFSTSPQYGQIACSITDSDI
jgi:hypothetical protein